MSATDRPDAPEPADQLRAHDQRSSWDRLDDADERAADVLAADAHSARDYLASAAELAQAYSAASGSAAQFADGEQRAAAFYGYTVNELISMPIRTST